LVLFVLSWGSRPFSVVLKAHLYNGPEAVFQWRRPADQIDAPSRKPTEEEITKTNSQNTDDQIGTVAYVAGGEACDNHGKIFVFNVELLAETAAFFMFLRVGSCRIKPSQQRL